MSDSGRTITAYHSGAEAVLSPKANLHVGTLAQAQMRGGLHLHRIEFTPSMRVPRLRDHGTWSDETLARHARKARVAVYLNRHEGISLDSFDKAMGASDIDRITDSRFTKLIPEAEDSWIILDPAAISTCDRIDWPNETD